MPKFRKKPVVVEAIQFTGMNTYEIIHWVHAGKLPDANTLMPTLADPGLVIQTPEGLMLAAVGDWIIRDVDGAFHTRKPDTFAATYEEVSE